MSDEPAVQDPGPDQPQTPEPPPVAVSVALEPHDPAASYLPVPGEWDIIVRQADVLAKSDLVPAAYRAKPANVVLATLAGRPFGWDASMAMRSFHIIEGQPTMKPEIMLALIRASGHSVRGTSERHAARITGVRCDNGDSMEVEFTIHDAEAAGLCTINSDGKPIARKAAGNGRPEKKLPWELYPGDMCWARAVSKLGRKLFSDVLLGAAYTPEEFGAFVDAEGEPVELGQVDGPAWAQPDAPPPPPQLIDPELARQLTFRARALPPEGQAVLLELLESRDITGPIGKVTAAKGRIVAPMVAAIESRAAQFEWGQWTKPEVPPTPHPPTDEDLGTEFNDPPKDDPPEVTPPAADDDPESEPPTSGNSGFVPSDEEEKARPAGTSATAEVDAMIQADNDAAALAAMDDQSGEPFEGPTTKEALRAAIAEIEERGVEAVVAGDDLELEEIPLLTDAEIVKMRKVPLVQSLGVRGLVTSGDVATLKARLMAFEEIRAQTLTHPAPPD